MQRKTRFALIGATTAAVVAIGGIGIASANDVVAGISSLSKPDRATHAERALHHQERQDAISRVVGLEWSAIEARLADGETLAAIAGEKKDELIKALVALAETHIDQHASDGRFNEEQATEMKASLTERVTAMVERNEGFGRHGFGGGFGPHRGGHGSGMGPGHGMGRGHHGEGFGFGPMGTPGTSGGNA